MFIRLIDDSNREVFVNAASIKFMRSHMSDITEHTTLYFDRDYSLVVKESMKKLISQIENPELKL